MRIVLNGETGQMVDHATGVVVQDLYDLHGQARPEVPEEVPSPPPARIARKGEPATQAPLRPRDVLRLARARVAEIKAELRRHESLRSELAQLQSLLAAAASARPPMKKLDQGTTIQ